MRHVHGPTGTPALLAALALALAACGGGDRPAGGGGGGGGDEGTPEPGGTAVILELSDMNKPLPPVFETSIDGDLMDVMFMGLTRGAWEDGRLVYHTFPASPMALAREWAYVGADSAGIRYRMRSDVRWSDGAPVTARDVKWTYDLVANPAVASPRQEYVEHLDSLVVEDDSTVVFWFDRHSPDMLFYSGLPIGPAHAFEGVDPAQIRNAPRLQDPANGKLPVSGAFMIGSWQRGSQFTLVPNPTFRPAPHLASIVVRVVPEATTRLVELQTQKADFMRPIPADQVDDLRAQAPFLRFLREEKRNYDYVGYNPRTVPAFADPEVRLALGLALDVEGIVGALRLGEFAVPAGAMYPPIFRDLYDPRRMAPLRQDTARARRILAERGWRDADGDGILEKDGRPFRFTLLTNAGNQRRADVSLIVQQQWRAIGVDARLQQTETNTFFDRLREKDFEAALSGWSVGLSPDITALWAPDSPFNFVSYDNPVVSQLFERAKAEPTSARANALWMDAAARIVQDRPYTWLYFIDTVVGVNERLRGVRVTTYGAYQNTWEWWIPRDRQRGAGPAPAAPAADSAARGG